MSGNLARIDETYLGGRPWPGIHNTPEKRSGWFVNRERGFSRSHLLDLFAGEIPCIRIPRFASAEDCARIVKAVKENAEFKGYSFQPTAPNILKVGPAQCEFGNQEKGDYFALARESEPVLQKIKRAAFSPLEQVMGLVSIAAHAKTSIADEGGVYGKYFAGVLRNISQGALLHMDFAPQDAKSWALEDVREQLTWNLYLQAPVSGGEAVVYSKQWDPTDEKYRVPTSYHYSDKAVEHAEHHTIPFVQGDLVIFNSRNFHRVKDSIGERLTMSSFFGKKPNGEIVFWS